MDVFAHRHAQTVEIEYRLRDSGGMVPANLVVTASIPLNPSSAGFNLVHVNALSKAAADYAKQKGIPAVTFKSLR